MVPPLGLRIPPPYCRLERNEKAVLGQVGLEGTEWATYVFWYSIEELKNQYAVLRGCLPEEG